MIVRPAAGAAAGNDAALSVEIGGGTAPSRSRRATASTAGPLERGSTTVASKRRSRTSVWPSWGVPSQPQTGMRASSGRPVSEATSCSASSTPRAIWSFWELTRSTASPPLETMRNHLATAERASARVQPASIRSTSKGAPRVESRMPDVRSRAATLRVLPCT